jgi:hypothetical protein
MVHIKCNELAHPALRAAGKERESKGQCGAAGPTELQPSHMTHQGYRKTENRGRGRWIHYLARLVLPRQETARPHSGQVEVLVLQRVGGGPYLAVLTLDRGSGNFFVKCQIISILIFVGLESLSQLLNSATVAQK